MPLELIIDVTNPERRGLLAGFDSIGVGAVPDFVRNDAALPIVVRPVVPSTSQNVPWLDDHASGDTYRVSIGNPDEGPDGGTFTLTIDGETTAALAFDITAAALQTALSAKSVAGGNPTVIVTELMEGAFQVDGAANGVLPLISGSATNLLPVCGILVNQLAAGSVSTKGRQIVQIYRQPVANNYPATAEPGGAGVSGILNLNTENLLKEFSRTEEQVLGFYMAVIRTRATAEAKTILQVPVRLHRSIIDIGTLSQIDSLNEALDVLVPAVVNAKIKTAVRFATTEADAATSLSTAFVVGQTVDGGTLDLNDRILIKDRAAQSQNGIYTVNASGAPTRAVDLNEWNEVPGAIVSVTSGVRNAGKTYLCTSPDGGTIGSSAIIWVQIGGTSFVGSKAYGFPASGETLDTFDNIDDAVQAVHALGGGTVWCPGGLYNEQILFWPDTIVEFTGGANNYYTGLGTMYIEPLEANTGQYKITGQGRHRKIVTNSAVNAAPPDITITNITEGSPVVVIAPSHGFPKYFNVTIAGTDSNPVTDGTFFATRIDANSFSFVPDAPLEQISTGGTATRVVEEHVIKCRYAASHFDCTAEHFEMFCDIQQTDGSKFSAFSLTKAIIHARFHTADTQLCTNLYMTSGRPDFIGERMQSTGNGCVTLDFNGDGESAAPGQDASPSWFLLRRLISDPQSSASRWRGIHDTDIPYLGVATVFGGLDASAAGSSADIIYAFLNIELLVSEYATQIVARTVPILKIDGSGGASFEFRGRIEDIKSANTAPGVPAVSITNMNGDGARHLEIGSVEGGVSSSALVVLDGNFTVTINSIVHHNGATAAVRLLTGARLRDCIGSGYASVGTGCVLHRCEFNASGNSIRAESGTPTLTAIECVAQNGIDSAIVLTYESTVHIKGIGMKKRYPTTLPATSGVVWNPDGLGYLAVSP